jgi:hypothetical protein
MEGDCTVTKISRRVALLGLMVFVATALYGAVGADAADSFAAHAAAPGYDTSALELEGHGGYATARSHTELRVTVCLQKRRGRKIGQRRSRRPWLRKGHLADDRDRRSAEPQRRMGPPGERDERPVPLLMARAGERR